MYSLGNNKRTEFIPDIERIVSEDSYSDTEAAFTALAAMASVEEIERIWMANIPNPTHPVIENAAIRQLKSILPIQVRVKAMGAVVGHVDSSKRRLLLVNDVINSYEVKNWNDVIDWIKLLQKLLDDQDVGVRRGACVNLFALFSDDIKRRHRIQWNSEGPLSEEEIDDIDNMRAYAEKRLETITRK